MQSSLVRDLFTFLEEDAPYGDITSEALIPDTARCCGYIKAHQSGVIAGVEEAATLFLQLGLTVTNPVTDGDTVKPGDTVMEVSGSAKAVLLSERTALNIIGRMSGIATATRECMGIVHGVHPSCRIAGTRKTAPGLRKLDKKAVRIGGGERHRIGLSDGILIKENHLELINIRKAIQTVRESQPLRTVEVEVSSEEDALEAARAGADIIMLDNMKPAIIRTTLVALEKEGLRKNVLIEISGGINNTNLAEYAVTGPDFISIGALTHSVQNFDLSLDLVSESDE
jgi:nicotinate-nucleotide pyrophosphorylase (carboxylating)